ncbi:MAG: tryptophan--tRNA ligase [Candidatus Kerfeldbacteria bacterium]|nr:tryptophan--tRNA ligase [Candidatus Kerfeldbacteria bacterium]
MPHDRVFSGLQPTGRLHIGNYFGAVKQWIALQESHECLYCIVDEHAITVAQDPKTFGQQTLDAAIDYLALGVDPETATIFVQSQVPEHTELAWVFSTLTPMGELERMTQFKEKAGAKKQRANAGLFTYPILMAADILLYHGTLVPVGEDQAQHVELTRKIARWFNNRFGNTFAEPKTKLTKAMRIMSLTDPRKKMSKSAGEKAYVALNDTPETIRKKIRAAVTATSGGADADPGVANLFTLLREVSDAKVVAFFEDQQRSGKILYAELKDQLARDLITHLESYRERRKELAANPEKVKGILNNGRERASAIARKTMAEVRERIGLLR